MTKSIENIKLKIICPECKRVIGEVWKARLDSVIGIRFAYICSVCNKLISLKTENESFTSNITAVIRE